MKTWRLAIGAASAAAGALGAVAFGACAIGAFAVAVFAIDRLKVGTARFERVEIDELVVRKLTLVERTESAGGSAPP